MWNGNYMYELCWCTCLSWYVTYMAPWSKIIWKIKNIFLSLLFQIFFKVLNVWSSKRPTNVLLLSNISEDNSPFYHDIRFNYNIFVSKDGLRKNLTKLDKNKNLNEYLYVITTNESNRKNVPINVQFMFSNFRFENLSNYNITILPIDLTITIIFIRNLKWD